MSRTVNINEEIIVVSEGKKDIGKFAILGNDGKFDPSVIPGMEGFEANLSSNGYQKLPSGLIIQWGYVTFDGSAGKDGQLITFPIPFTAECYQVLTTDAGSGVHIISAAPVSTTQFRVWSKAAPTFDYTGAGLRYLAIGK